MATTSTYLQGRTAAGGAAFAERWPVAAAAVPASKRRHLIVTNPMPSTSGVKHANGITRRKTEGSS